MSIRIIDQSPDHSAQNPPPENQVGEAESASGNRQIVVAGATTPDGESHVFRGKAVGCVDDLTFSVGAAPAVEGADGVAPAADVPLDTFQPVSLANCVEVPTLSWTLRPSAGTYKVGTGEERLVLKLPPRWALEPLTPEGNAKTGDVQ